MATVHYIQVQCNMILLNVREQKKERKDVNDET
jgi:hypothetical protein